MSCEEKSAALSDEVLALSFINLLCMLRTQFLRSS